MTARYAIGIAVLAIAVCQGCAAKGDSDQTGLMKPDATKPGSQIPAGNASSPARPDASNASSTSQGVNLATLIRLNWVLGKRTTLFFDPKTGKRVKDINLYLISDFSEGLAVASQQGDGTRPYVYVDTAGRTVMPSRFYSAEPFHDGRAVVTIAENNDYRRQKPGLIDRKGRWIVRPGQYDELGTCYDGCCPFRVGKLWGLLDANGTVIVKPRFIADQYHQYHKMEFQSGLAAVYIRATEDAPTVYVDTRGRVMLTIPPGTTGGGSFYDGRALIWVVMDANAPSPEYKYDRTSIFFSPDYKYGFMDRAGKIVIAPTYEHAARFSEGLAPVTHNARTYLTGGRDVMADNHAPHDPNSWGYINTEGKLVIDFQFEQVGKFCCGLARACKGRRWGYIDKTGKWVVPPRYGWAKDFRNGYAEVWAKTVLFVDRSGKVVVDTGIPAVTF